MLIPILVIIVTMNVNVVLDQMMTNVHVVMIILIYMRVNVHLPVQKNIGQTMLQTLVIIVIHLVKPVSEQIMIIVTHAHQEPISIIMNVKSHAQMELMKKKHQFNHVRIVTKDVLFVKTPLITHVVNVMMDTTYMKLHVLHVLSVNYSQDGIVMPQLTLALNAPTNVRNVQQHMTIVTLVPNQE